MHTLRIEPFAAGQLEQGLQQVAANPCSARVTGYAKAISAAGDLYIEAAFDLSQVLIELSAKIGETAVIGGFQDDVPGYWYGVQWLGF
ncbi:MAG: hypothetical protein BMS9Abin32_679 [Gammaproteobacteria bacterium]|nr:MAG: hypothetical protein BMS9Abin32_679 [Gammaproteobacteria bacterium]